MLRRCFLCPWKEIKFGFDALFFLFSRFFFDWRRRMRKLRHKVDESESLFMIWITFNLLSKMWLMSSSKYKNLLMMIKLLVQCNFCNSCNYSHPHCFFFLSIFNKQSMFIDFWYKLWSSIHITDVQTPQITWCFSPDIFLVTTFLSF